MDPFVNGSWLVDNYLAYISSTYVHHEAVLTSFLIGYQRNDLLLQVQSNYSESYY